MKSSLVQQMMGGSPNLWSMNNLMPPSQEMSTVSASSSTSSSSLSSSMFPKYSKPASFNSMMPCHENQELPESWSQLLLGGLVEEEGGCRYSPYSAKSMENWENQMIYTSANAQTVDVKQANSETAGHAYYYAKDEETQADRPSWSQAVPASSPRSCCNSLGFSNCKAQRTTHQSDHLSKCNSNSGATFKDSRVQASSAQANLKVRKEKLGDRIAALHQLVSPFGKTDTASVLLEAIGYIRFLQSQIEALSSPYLGSGSGNMKQSQDADSEPEDLRSRGLCLVPVSFTLHVGSENIGADLWAPNFGMDFP